MWTDFIEGQIDSLQNWTVQIFKKWLHLITCHVTELLRNNNAENLLEFLKFRNFEKIQKKQSDLRWMKCGNERSNAFSDAAKC